MQAKQEKSPSPETEIKNIEVAPLQEQEKEAVQSLTERYVEAAKIDPKSIKAIDGFLAADTEKAYQEFALKWFEDNKEKIKEEGKIIPPDASNEWKISMVLGSQEKGGMGASADVRKENYKAEGGALDKIGVLRADMKKNQIPPETPFLLLDRLQIDIERAKEEMEELEARAGRGEKSAEIEAASKEEQLAELFSARKELAERVLGDDLRRKAEELVDGEMIPKTEWVERMLHAKEEEIRGQRNKELVEKI